MKKNAPKDPRKERLAKQLRANLQRRKEQARERQPEQGEDDIARDGQPKSGSSRGDT